VVFIAIKLSAAVDELRIITPRLGEVSYELRSIREVTLADIGENVSAIKDHVDAIEEAMP
jgi:hypothetical protein